jgi:hypothetical protein
MIHQWSQMTNEEKNLVIARDVLKFNCFETKKGVNWYQKHYDLGQWRYCTRLTDAFDLSERLLNEECIDIQVLLSKENFECILISHDENRTPIFKTEGSTLPEVICLAALYLKGIKFNYEKQP